MHDFHGKLDSDINAVEEAVPLGAWARRRQFQISPATRPPGLEQALIARGYKHKPTTGSDGGGSSGLSRPLSHGVQILSAPDAEFCFDSLWKVLIRQPMGRSV